MKALIVCGGKAPEKELVLEELKDSNIVIGADKGAETLYKYGVKPTLIVGDFDSIDEDIFNYYKKNNINLSVFPVEKDFTDSEAAVKKAMDMGADKIALLGCTGSRLDHVLSNINLLYYSLISNIECYIRDEFNYIRMVDKSTYIKKDKFKYFSLLSFKEDVINLTIHGAKYPLNNHHLKVGYLSGLGVSNEIKENEAYIDFSSGILLIIQSRD
ncbi:thiamine diphosphokinase [Clostridium cochlearium]|uniref:Thiamine diphosphokinase n=1 Tax=Clostridium cochlearium TaxID=1494 RepID=A0ABY0QJR9_CLOCO|nr:thiamine diphosphokinase [Clostridium cochlearium]SDK99425.1 thiamine diphosphokinase [Clostridium cochlearium]